MEPLKVQSAAEQVATHLRERLWRGAWGGRVPGGNLLASELGVGRNTVETALQLLEAEGVLMPQGARRCRLVNLPEAAAEAPALRVAILSYFPLARANPHMMELQYQLADTGHESFFTKKSLVELGMDVTRVAALVEQTPADAWVVFGGSRRVLQWFAAQPFPTMACFGWRSGLPIAGVGPDKSKAIRAAARRLIELGHRRIVMVAYSTRRKPAPGDNERTFLDELEAHGITTGEYHLPDWVETANGLNSLLERLFRVTPPTALILDERPIFLATQQFLLHRGLRVPADVSLVCADRSADFTWCRPTVAHVDWDIQPVLRRISRWATNARLRKRDVRQTLTAARFNDGGTIGAACG